MTRLTKKYLAQIRARAEGATPGPWKMAGTKEKPCPSVSSWDDEKGYQVHSMLHVKESMPDVWDGMAPIYCADAEFIAASRSDVSALLEALEKSQAALQRIALIKCRCSGYLGPCGCGDSARDTAEDALLRDSDDEGA